MKQQRIKGNLTPDLDQQTLACKVTEHIVAFIWEKQLFNNPEIYCVNPGRRNNDSGPDFKDAILINTSGKTIFGDVEIHVKTNDWYSHGHQHDHVYNKVVLHVSLWEDHRNEVFLQNGLTIQNISLFPFLSDSWDRILHLYNNHSEEQHRCLIQPHSTMEIIQRAGEQRFRQKVKSFKKKLQQEVSSQVLYTGIMRALGYSKNKEQLELISKAIPLTDLIKNNKTFQAESRLLILESLLLGSGGLLFN